MAIETVNMPNYGMHMEEGTVETWFVSEGDPVDVGTEICEISESKAVHVIESKVKGVLSRIVVPEGETAEVGALLGEITLAE